MWSAWRREDAKSLDYSSYRSRYHSPVFRENSSDGLTSFCLWDTTLGQDPRGKQGRNVTVASESTARFVKVWFTSHLKIPTWDSKLGRTNTSAFFFFLFPVLQLSFLSVYYCFTRLDMGNEHFDKWPERWSSFSPASFFKNLRIFLWNTIW